MLLPWLTIIACNSVSVMVFQAFVLVFQRPVTRARVCFFLSWYTHSMASRLRLPLRQYMRGSTTRLDPEASPSAQPWVHQGLYLVMVVICFVLSVTLSLEHSLWHTTAWLLLFTALKHAHAVMHLRWPSVRSRVVDLVCKLWVSVLTYSTACSFFYLTHKHLLYQSHRAMGPAHMLLGGVGWPVLRHLVRWAVFSLLLDPHGSRGPVRVYASLVLDLPLFISIFSQPGLETVWTLLVCTMIVDSLAVLCWRMARVSSM